MPARSRGVEERSDIGVAVSIDRKAFPRFTSRLSQTHETVLLFLPRPFAFLNIIAYDATGPRNPDDHGQHSSMEFAQEAVKDWTGRGVPKGKVVVGVPFSGYGFGKA
jgi:hypothetical protein